MNRTPVFAFTLSLLALRAPAAAQVWEVGNRLLTLPGGSQAEAAFGFTLAVGDFDGDGNDDLVVQSSPGSDPGRIDLFLGSPSGPQAAVGGSVVGTAGLVGFGSALAAGDFDSDPEDELAVGVPFATVVVNLVPIVGAGVVQIYDWTGTSWVLAGTFSQNSAGVPGNAEAEDWFGLRLAVGDFDDNGYGDLAVGVPFEAVGATAGAGAVNVFYGGPSGIGTTGAQIWHRSGGGVSGTAGDFDSLGWALATGDFDSDGVDDLGVGIPMAEIDAVENTGDVVVLFGSTGDGLVGTGQQRFDPTDLGEDADGQGFGSTLASAEFNPSFTCAFLGTCADDLVVGAPDTDVSFGIDVPNAGRIWVLGGSESANGIDLASAVPIDQGDLDPFEATQPELSDGFGRPLAVGALDPVAGADLVVGTPGEAFEATEDAGCVHALFGGAIDLTGKPSQFLYARTGLAAAPLAAGDSFGDALAIGDFDADGWGDLAVGVPFRNLDDQSNAGAVQILYGALFADGFGTQTTDAWVVP